MFAAYDKGSIPAAKNHQDRHHINMSLVSTALKGTPSQLKWSDTK